MNSASEVDVLVAGGGPAGAVVALCLARRGLRVRLLEASMYKEARYGETLPPEINPALRELGLWNAFEELSLLPAYGTISAWGEALPVETDFIRNVHGPGWHVDRCALDRMLAREAEKAGVQVCLGEKVDLRRSGDGFWLAKDCRARFLVDATGRNGLRIDGSAEREVDDELIAIALTFELPREGSGDLRTCIETTPDGWWYSAPLPQGGLIAMFFTDPAIYREQGIVMGQQLEYAVLTARRLASGCLRSSRVMRVSSSCRREMFGDRWLAVGDSACALDPLSGRGVFNALRWAAPAADAIAAWFERDPQSLPVFAARIKRQYWEYVRQRRTHYAGERRWAERSFWRQRLDAPQAVAVAR